MRPSQTTFRHIATPENYGHVFIHHYQTRDRGEQTLVFFPVPPQDNNMLCGSCGLNVWNAHNMANLVHFCPNREVSIIKTDFKVSQVSTLLCNPVLIGAK